MPSDRLCPRRQRGVTTLVTVMVLFFIMALVAAYANRNLVLEQRTALNFQRIGTAHQINHQAVAHLMGLFNAGKVNDACQINAAGAGTMRQRYLLVDEQSRIDVPAATRGVHPNFNETAPFTIACDRVRGGNWTCQCPSDFAPGFVAEDGLPRESYIARVRQYTVEATIGRPSENLGRFGLSVLACVAPSAACQQARDPGQSSDVAISTRAQSLILLRALKMPPVSAVVARGRVALGTGMAAAHNEPAFGGIAIQAGGLVDGDRSQVSGPAGSPGAGSVVANEVSLVTPDADRYFRMFFGMPMADYVAQPAARQLTCDGGCAGSLRDLADAGVQLIHHAGDLVLSDEVSVGSVAQPVVLVVDGRLTINGPVRIVGIVFSTQDLTWSNLSASPSLVQGAVLSAGNVIGGKGASALFDGTVLNRLKFQAGSYVPLPGGSIWDAAW